MFWERAALERKERKGREEAREGSREWVARWSHMEAVEKSLMLGACRVWGAGWRASARVHQGHSHQTAVLCTLSITFFSGTSV